jgi:hypothetical protein
MIGVMADTRARDRMRWARRTGPPGSRLTEAEAVALRQACAAEHARGLALLARSPLAEIIGAEGPEPGHRDENSQTV